MKKSTYREAQRIMRQARKYPEGHERRPLDVEINEADNRLYNMRNPHISVKSSRKQMEHAEYKQRIGQYKAMNGGSVPTIRAHDAWMHEHLRFRKVRTAA